MMKAGWSWSRMLFLSALRRRPDAPVDLGRFPWTLPLVRDLEAVAFRTPVTFLVGENGSGKSTLLEGIAAGIDAVAAGSHDLRRDPSLRAARDFAAGFVFERRHHARTRLFLRAEDVFGYTGRLAAEMAELAAIEQELGELPEGPGRDRATAMARAERSALQRRYGADPDARSHGETFLALLQTRLVPNGLYVLDEPETPLSPARVLALIALLADRVACNCQFIIATHSPILMAFPGATILHAEDGVLYAAEWNELDHVRVMRAFLNDPQAVLRKVLDEPGEHDSGGDADWGQEA
jgi:predicted ATPase